MHVKSKSKIVFTYVVGPTAFGNMPPYSQTGSYSGCFSGVGLRS